MAAAKRYLFDISFDRPESHTPVEREVEERFTRAELDSARAAALAEGRDAGLAEAKAADTAKMAAALEAVTKGLATLLSAVDARAFETERQAAGVLRSLVAKTFPALAAKAPLAEIETFAVKYLLEASEEPRVVLRVANEIYEAVQSQLGALTGASAYAGRIVLLADERLASGDASIEWADGGAERNLGDQLAEIDELIARLCDPNATVAPLSPAGDDV